MTFLLGLDDAEDLEVVLLEGESGEVGGVGVDEVFGDGIEFGHGFCLGCGWGGIHNRQESCHGVGSEGRLGIGGVGV